MSLWMKGPCPAGLTAQQVLDAARVLLLSARAVLGEVRRADVGGEPYIVRNPEASDDLSKPLSPQQVLSIYVPGLSTAGVELTREGDKLSLRVLSFATDDDYRLAQHLIVALSQGKPESFETDHEVTVAELHQWTGRAEARQAAFQRLGAMYARRQSAWLQTPLRPFWPGPQVWAQAGQNAERLIAMVRELVRVASGPTVSGIATSEHVRLNYRVPLFGFLQRTQIIEAERYILEQPQLLMANERVLLRVGELRVLQRWADFVATHGEHLRWLDEKSVVVEVPASSRAAVEAAAAARAERVSRAPA